MSIARSGGVDLYYELHGPPLGSGRTPAVLVMGLASDVHAWEKQIPVLAKDRPVLALDNRGVGRSGKPNGPYTTAGLAADLAAVLDAAAIPVAHVAGISLGGMIAQEFALKYPTRVKSLALLATFARADADLHRTADAGAQASSGQTVAQLFSDFASSPANLDVGAVFSFMMKRVFSPAYLANEAAYLQGFFMRSLAYGFSPEGLVGQMAAAMSHDTTRRLGALSMPTLVVLGAADELIPPDRTRDVARLIPGSRLVEIPGGTHGLNLEFPEEVNKLLQTWFFEND